MRFRFRSLAFTCGVLLLASVASALTAPKLQYSGTGNSLKLWMKVGPAVSPAFITQRMCETAVGDEVCGLYAVVTSSGNTTITFAPISPAVRHRQVSPNEIRILKLAAAEPNPGDSGMIQLGTINVSGAVQNVTVHTDSKWVRADGVLAPLVAEPLPEPSRRYLWLAGIGLVVFLARRRLRSGSLALLVLGILAAPHVATAQTYRTQTGFTNALGAGSQLEEFDEPEVNGNGYAAVSNGHDFGGMIWTSNSLAGDVDLFDGPDTGLDGTLLIEGTTDAIAEPGGNGASGSPESNDDFSLLFAPSVDGAGLLFIGNTVEASEVIEWLDEQGAVIHSETLPGGSFIGYVRAPGEAKIAEVRVSESGSGSDNIAFDKVIWKETVAYTVTPFTPRPRVDDWDRIGPADLPYPPGFPNPPSPAGDSLGVSVAAIGDLNRDDVVDLVIGAQNAEGGDNGVERGSVAIAFLERDGTLRRFQRISDHQGGLSGPSNIGGVLEDEDNFGRSVAPLGDFDGDGVLDIAVGTQPSLTPGDIFLLFLEPDGTVKSYHRIDESDPELTGLLDPNDWFGTSLAVLPDLDGNGTPELAVGAAHDDDAGNPDAGAVYILFLNTDGTVLSKVKITDAQGGFPANMIDPNDHFGYDVEAIGDLNRDGYPDLAVSARRDDDAGTNRGAVYVLFLDANANVIGNLTKKIVPTNYSIPVGGLPYALADGDEFGAGLAWIATPDAAVPGVLAIGAPLMDATFGGGASTGQGAIFFVALQPDGTPQLRSGVVRTVSATGGWYPGLFTPTNAAEMTGLGFAMAPIGDLDGDGFTDLATGAHLADLSGHADAGALYLMYLDGTDPTAFADAVAATAGTVLSPSLALGAPGGGGSYLASTGGGTLTVQLVNNALRRDGTSRPDLIVHRSLFASGGDPGDTSMWTVRVSANGTTFHQVFSGQFFKCLTSGEFCATADQWPIDLDAAGVPDQEFRFVQFQQPQVCVEGNPFLPPLCPFEPRVDAVEAVDNLNFVTDGDFDGFANGFDVCPTTFDPGQEDGDNDGAGDYCDNCIDDPNPDQRDSDGDGRGNTCDITGVRLIPTQTSGEWDLRVVCPDAGLSKVYTAVQIPATVDRSSVTFGGPTPAQACKVPGPFPNFPDGAPPSLSPSTGCTNASTAPGDLGPNVARSGASGAIGPNVGGGESGIRTDTIYLVLAAPSSGFICTPNQEAILGRLYFDPPASGAGVPTLTDKGLGTPGLEYPVSKQELVVGKGGGVGSGSSVAIISASPKQGQTAGQETDWEVCVQSDNPLHRLSFSLTPPAYATHAQMYWQGCNGSTSGPIFHRTCSSFASTYSDRVKATPGLFGSHTYGPDGSQDTVMVVTLEAGGPQVSPDNIRAFTGQPVKVTCLGVVSMPTFPGRPPELGMNNLDVIPLPAGFSPIMEAIDDSPANFIPDALLDYEDLGFSTNPDAAEDTDLDGVRDDDDRCPYIWNDENHVDTGGLLSTSPDGIGDSCQCGDADESGAMLVSDDDLDRVVEQVLGISTAAAPRELCSLAGGIECNLLDAVRLQLALSGQIGAAALEPKCERAQPPVIGPPGLP